MNECNLKNGFETEKKDEFGILRHKTKHQNYEITKLPRIEYIVFILLNHLIVTLIKLIFLHFFLIFFYYKNLIYIFFFQIFFIIL